MADLREFDAGLDGHGKAVWFELELRSAPRTPPELVQERRRWRRVSAG